MSEVPHMPTHDEILKKALTMYMMRNPDMPMPEEDELKEGSWFDAARRELMSGVKSQLEGYLSYLEAEAESIRDELGIKPAPPPREVRELEEQIDSLSVRLGEAKSRLRTAKEEVERLKAVKIPPKVIKAPPKPLEKLMCPAHKIELMPVIGEHAFPWERINVPSEMFLFQCPIEFEYYICEPRKRCELIRLDTLKRRLAAIIKPITPPRVRAPILEAAEREPDFVTFLREVGITMEDYRRLDMMGKFVMRGEYRRWKKSPY